MNNELIFRVVLGILFLITLVTRRYFDRQATATAEEGLLKDRDNQKIKVHY